MGARIRYSLSNRPFKISTRHSYKRYLQEAIIPIRRRLENTVPISLEPEVVVHRDTFDPSRDAYSGSFYDTMGVPQGQALAVAKFYAYTDKPPLPSQMSVQDLLALTRLPNNPHESTEHRYAHRIRSPLTGIRAFCVSCKGGSPKKANECDKMDCPIWAFRLGQNAFYGRR